MKTILTLFLFLLFTLSVKAQSYKSNLIKTVESINSMLQPNKMVRFTDQNYNTFYPTKINANLQGDVICVDSLSAYSTKPNGIMFNLLKVKSFVIKADEIVAFGQDQETIIAIGHGNESERQALRKELYALLIICRLYSEQDPRFKCD
ncbi:hypothetical protein [Flavobacterium sp.]|uniref:hypothetical protein n=1 Tax=Flavobacterium sp. TaxID=239 RepID=UPI00286CDDD6|nr:hypothetical protein [Flavobacterium sp.]